MGMKVLACHHYMLLTSRCLMVMSQVTRRVCASLCQVALVNMWSDENEGKEGTRRESYSDYRVIQPRCGTRCTVVDVWSSRARD
jgi:hypothetical protein